MEPATAFVLAASVTVAQRIRETLVRVHALVWANGKLLAARVQPKELRSIIATIANERDVRIYPGSLPDDVLIALPVATQMLIKAQQQSERRHPAPSGGIGWDAPGFEAPRHLKKQGA